MYWEKYNNKNQERDKFVYKQMRQYRLRNKKQLLHDFVSIWTDEVLK